MTGSKPRAPSNSSSTSASSPRKPPSFFGLRRLSSRDDRRDSDKVHEVSCALAYSPFTTNQLIQQGGDGDKIVSSIFSLPVLEPATRGSNGIMPSPDPFLFASHDKEYLRLLDHTKRIRKVSQEPKKIDTAWEIYEKSRNECYQICKSLFNKSRKYSGRQTSLELEIGPFDTRLSHSGSSSTGSTLPHQFNDTWLLAIQRYKAAQQEMHDMLRGHILSVFKEYRPESSEKQAEDFLASKEVRKSVILHWREISIHRMMSEKLLFWDLFRIRSQNFHTLTQDILAIDKLFDVIDSTISENMSIREYVISKDGDTILEFPNGASEEHPILRFRVSSHFLVASSSLFSRIFSPLQGADTGLVMDDLPPPPTKHICEDKMEVKLRLQVQYVWLRQWIQMASDDGTGRDGLLLISYVFGEPGLFRRLTKSVILNTTDEADIESKTLWPQPIKDKMKAIRAAKMAQIHGCLTNAISEYFRPPQDSLDRPTSIGSLTLTTVPRCPRGVHLCDATNLGWLMLVYNELRILPTAIGNAGFSALPDPPRRSLKELLDCLRLMPSTPEGHSGVCDYAPAFRSAISDIYNSISGLQLEEVGPDLLGQGITEPVADQDLTPVTDLSDVRIELPVPPLNRPPISSQEAIRLCILSHLDDIDDLNSAAQVDKKFYAVYKENETTLLKTILKNAKEGERKSRLGPRMAPLIEDINEQKSLASDNILSKRFDNLYDSSPPLIPTSRGIIPMNNHDPQDSLSLVDSAKVLSIYAPRHKGDRNQKYLPGEAPHLEEKARMGEGHKQLQEEKDMVLGLSAYKSKRVS
ncbi:hypothetical protein OIDMADRAFT_107748 [Oidiodendron maius Zn]|uniref:Uncharacterized protein n=1 Tax=Oidiodendron maius (strain Zn) TaxID=913774 RepID=A0A0C3E137_OIDMZ|nr:hypothetical protein OIDMADRAFT_107748 [Oidiodendron maius Zn]